MMKPYPTVYDKYCGPLPSTSCCYRYCRRSCNYCDFAHTEMSFLIPHLLWINSSHASLVRKKEVIQIKAKSKTVIFIPTY